MSFFDPDAIKTDNRHVGQTYKLTSEDARTATDLAKLLSRFIGREINVFEGDTESLRGAPIANGAPGEHAPAMARYFPKVAAGVYAPVDTAAKILGRTPLAFADWLAQNPPVALTRD